jgi:hypothetical protein
MSLFRTLLTVLTLALPSAAAEIALTGGIGPSHRSSVDTPAGTVTANDSTGTVVLDVSSKLIGLGPVSINWDAPIGFGGRGRAQVFGSTAQGTAYADRMQWAFTPGLKARLGLGLLSPWFSFGAGFARVEQAGAEWTGISGGRLGSGNSFALALSPAGGIDIHPIPVLFLRGEVRSYNFRSPGFDALATNPLKGNWRDNLLFLGGIGLRF